MLYLTNGWPLSRARVLIGRSIGKHWRAEFYTYTYILGVFTVMDVTSCCIIVDVSSCCTVAIESYCTVSIESRFLFRRMAFEPLSIIPRTPVETVDTVSAITFCTGFFGVRCAPLFTCGDLLLGRRGLLFFGDLAILEN